MEESQEGTGDSRTPIIILGIATALLIVVGFTSFSKYVAAQSDLARNGGLTQTQRPSTQDETISGAGVNTPQTDEAQRIRDLLGPGVVEGTKDKPPKVTEQKSEQQNGEVKASDINQLIGQVISFNADWNFVTVDAGADKGLKIGQMFLIKRGEEPLGKVKVQQVGPIESVLGFVSDNKVAGSLKPKPGDKIYK